MTAHPGRQRRATGLMDRRSERDALDRLVVAVRAGESRSLVVRGDDPRVLRGSADVFFGHGGNLDRVEVMKDLAEGRPMRFDDRPAQAGLEDRPDELFKVTAIIAGSELEVRPCRVVMVGAGWAVSSHRASPC
jgi:hypothetical protein